MNELPRRVVLRRAVQIAAAMAIAPQIIRGARAEDSCVDASSESLRGSLNYTSVSVNPAQPCSGCGFFTADAGKAACGACVIMSGTVDATGHCDSWAAPG